MHSDAEGVGRLPVPPWVIGKSVVFALFKGNNKKLHKIFPSLCRFFILFQAQVMGLLSGSAGVHT